MKISIFGLERFKFDKSILREWEIHFHATHSDVELMSRDQTEDLPLTD